MVWKNASDAIESLRKQSIQDRRVFITGGNSGFGYNLAKFALQSGATVIIGCRSEGKAIETCDELKEYGEISYLVVDIGNPKSVIQCANTIKQKGISFDILVNNAGVLVPKGKTQDESHHGRNLCLDTNFIGTINFTVHMIPFMKGDHCRIVSVTSVLYPKGFFKAPYKELLSGNCYANSKYCLVSAMISLSRKYPEIMFVLCDPGIAATSIARHLGVSDSVINCCCLQSMLPPAPGALTMLCGVFSPLNLSEKENYIILKNQKRIPFIKKVLNEAEQDECFRLAIDETEKIVNSMSQ